MSVEYITEDLSSHPLCPHGPTLLFSRRTNNGIERYYACSACRERKDCTFYEREGDKMNHSKKNMWDDIRHQLVNNIDHHLITSVLEKVRKEEANRRCYCLDCNQFYFVKNGNDHSYHKVKNGITNHELSFPSEFLKPLENDKKEAQYLFAKQSVVLLIEIFQKLKLNNILCIGSPRIHEYIQMNCSKMKSLLLDFDSRYINFFGPEHFCWYNLFNNYFFLPGSQEVMQNFLKNDRGRHMAIVMDPPFGGRVEPIAQTLQSIQELHNSLNGNNAVLPLFLFFPYFMEPYIINSLPDMKMADYQVEYQNHSLFQNKKGRKYGSPVRIFTNVHLNDVRFDHIEGYKYCLVCRRSVYLNNNHCAVCNECTSKDGRTYVHCKTCKRCVKSTWIHCSNCRRCHFPNNSCCKEINFSLSCFNCNREGHKKVDCPLIKQKEAIKVKKKLKLHKGKTPKNNKI